MSLCHLPQITYQHRNSSIQQIDFEELMGRLQNENILAIDTEANSLFAYKEQVCLIQISTETNDYIVDPLLLG